MAILNLDDTSVLHAGNNVNARLGLAGSVFENKGILDLTNGAYSLTDTSTVSGNYVGTAGSELWLNTFLGDSTSPTDKLIVNGGTSGETLISITRDPDSPGAFTRDNGILVARVDNDAASNATFVLDGDYEFEGDPAVIGGAYAYRLFKNGVTTPTDGDWYLRSVRSDGSAEPQPLYQPGTPLYENYGKALLGLNGLPSLQQRVGNRYWNEPEQKIFCKDPAQNFQCTVTADQASYYADGGYTDRSNAVWGRIEGAHGSYDLRNSTSLSDYDQNIFKLQAGLDGKLAENSSGWLIGGLTAHYGTMKTNVSSIFGTGEINTDGYGVGANLTWYGNNGFYVDGQASVTWYDSDLVSDWAGTMKDGNDALGYALSLETGKRFELDRNWVLTPQAQLVYSTVKFDNFTDNYDARVIGSREESLHGRLGLAIERQTNWKAEDDTIRKASLYGIANLYYDFMDGSPVDVSTVRFENETDRLWGEVGIGGTVSLAKNTELYGEARYATSLRNFTDSYTVGGNLGIRVNW